MELQICLQNLGKYNEGELIYKWVDALDHEDWDEELEEIGVADDTKYEEYMIADYSTDINGLTLDEYEDLDRIDEIAEIIKQVEEDNGEDAFEALVDCLGLDEGISCYESGNFSYYPDMTTEEELGEYVVNEGLFGVEIPEALQNYIDYEAVGRDWNINSGGGFAGNGFIDIY